MDPVRFVFGVHFHQPVGNFDHVFAEHLRDVYRPLVERLTEQRFLPFALHSSGPVLASLTRPDRLEQIGWMRAAIQRRFGVEATGLWLTERVWEPDLATDLADAGVRYLLVDDRHFLVSGFERDRLHAPFLTESGGKRAVPSPCSWMTARSSAAGPEPRTGCTRAAGSPSSATQLRHSWRPAKSASRRRARRWVRS